MPTNINDERIEIVKNYRNKYPYISDLKLSKIMAKEKPIDGVETYGSYRDIIRKASKSPKKELNTDINFDTDFDIDIREGIINHRKPYLIPSSYKRILVISDIHVPYHDVNALKLALKYAWDNGAQMIIINGDFLDMYSESDFDKNPENRNVAYEIEVGRVILKQIKDKFKNTKIVYKFGNHEDRHIKYLMKKADKLFGVEEVWLENLLKLREMGIDFVDSKDVIKCDDLRIIHGHEIKAGGSVNVQRSIFLKTYMNTLAGHFHREGKSIVNTLDGNLKGCWTTGCLCDLSPDYAAYNQWNHGFAWIERDNGTFTVSLKTIINGKVL